MFKTFEYPVGTTYALPEALNLFGAIVGGYYDVSGVEHGYLRTLDGKFTTIDAPGVGTANGQGTQANLINIAGEIVGTYGDATGAPHCFLWIP
jgi:hypothetical protein